MLGTKRLQFLKIENKENSHAFIYFDLEDDFASKNGANYNDAYQLNSCTETFWNTYLKLRLALNL